MKKIFYAILIALTCLIGLNKVSASSDFTNSYIRVNGNDFFDNGVIINSSDVFRFDVGVFYNGSITQNTNNRIYGRLALCTSNDVYSPYSHTDYVNTNISCEGGTVSFIYFDLTYQTHGNFTTYFELAPLNSSSADVDFFGLSFSYTPFDRYNSDDTLIKQNDVILSDLQSLYYITSDGLSQICYKLDDAIEDLNDLKSLLSQLLNSCRDSYNLFDINRAYSYGDETNSSVTGNSLTVNGKWFAYQIYNLKQNTDYYLSFNKEILQYAPGIGLVRIFSGSNTGNIIKQIDSSSFSFNTGDNTSVGILFFSSANGVDIGIIKLSNIMLNEGISPKPYEKYGEQICKSKVDETNDAINESNKKLDETNNKLQQQQDFMNDDDTSGSSSEAQEFFEGFDTDTYGLTSIITAPLELIGNLAGSTCSPLPLEIPFVGGTFNLPCMSSIYKKHFGSFLTIYQTITFGIVAYWVCVRIFALVKDFKNPEHDEIEVMDL